MCTMYLATILRNVSIKVIYKYVYELDISYAYTLIAMCGFVHVFFDGNVSYSLKSME